MDPNKRFNQNYSANKICCFSTKENSPFIKQQYCKVKAPQIKIVDKTDEKMVHSRYDQDRKLEKYEPSLEKPPSKMGNKIISDKKSVFNKIDINSISVRKFNLDICEKPCIQQQFHNITTELKRVCLPIFSQDILDSLSKLDINSNSASKSLQSLLSA
jgi:hypothetical protein